MRHVHSISIVRANLTPLIFSPIFHILIKTSYKFGRKRLLKNVNYYTIEVSKQRINLSLSHREICDKERYTPVVITYNVK